MAYIFPIAVLILGVTIIYFTNYPTSEETLVSLNTSYDYIIIGAGSAGCVLANRLSEDQSSTVLLLEAGGTENKIPVMKVPLADQLLHNIEEDWAFRTVSQRKACLAMEKQQCAWPRGKTLGGSSSINSMQYVRCSRHDYDKWAKEGCEGWSYKDVLPYFIKSEDIRVGHLHSSEYHGKGGPMVVSDGQATYLNHVYREGMKELGYKVIDCNGKSQVESEPLGTFYPFHIVMENASLKKRERDKKEGFCSSQETVGGGERWSGATGFLRPAMDRTNLHVSIKSHVSKVVIEKKNAVGVQFIRDGKKHIIRTNKEVILSGGAISSPQILMLSGIGPKDHLKNLGIPVVMDLPVGDNLQDHVMFPLRFWDKSGSSITDEMASSFSSLLQYFLFKTASCLCWLRKEYRPSSNKLAIIHAKKGVLSKVATEGNAFFTDSDSQLPYLQIIFRSMSQHLNHVDRTVKNWNFDKKMENHLKDTLQRVHEKGLISFFILPMLLHPKSKGTIRLQSKDPFDPPLIDPNYLDHPDDAKNLLRGVRKSLELSNTTAFRKIGSSMSDPIEENVHFCKEHVVNSDEYWICRIRHLTFSGYHPTSTCRMGATDDPTAVVDPALRVKGINGLRVIDASIMRDVPSGNTNAPTVMMAEKGSDLIRGIDSVRDLRQKIMNL